LSLELGRRLKIVTCDDEKSLLEVYEALLSSRNHILIRSFLDGEELVDFVTKNVDDASVPDLIIIDYRMPLMNGLEAAKRIKAFNPEIKLILASAYNISSDETYGVFDAILKKPFSAKQLLETIREVGT
jgi:two-component system chemotaxis response regulator CheY